jgi:hypothetical protein
MSEVNTEMETRQRRIFADILVLIQMVIPLSASSRAVFPNLWYAYPWGYAGDRFGLGYAKIILVMAENTKKKIYK